MASSSSNYSELDPFCDDHEMMINDSYELPSIFASFILSGFLGAAIASIRFVKRTKRVINNGLIATFMYFYVSVKRILYTEDRHRYRSKNKKEDDGCAVCLCEFKEGEEIRELECYHVFHISCLTRWLDRYSATCPLCRSHVPPPPPPDRIDQTGHTKWLSEQHRRLSNETNVDEGQLLAYLCALHEVYLSKRYQWI